MQVPFSRPSIRQADVEAVVDVLWSGWLAVGSETHRFEQAFAQRVGVPHAVATNSCTSALEAALQVAGVTGEVILPSFTWVATANATINAGATPIFAEVDPGTYNVTASSIAERLTPRTEAVIVIHYGGQPCQMTEISALCQRHGLLLIEDSAETIGATWCGREAGSFGVGCFSFYPTKAMTTAQGGMLTCTDETFARKVRAFIAHGLITETPTTGQVHAPWQRAAELAGHNYRLPNLLAALGLEQLKRLDTMNHCRQTLARRYDALLTPLKEEVLPPVIAPGADHVYQMYSIRVTSGDRDGVLRRLWELGIGASIHFDPPVHLQPFYIARGGLPGMLPVTETLTKQILTLPIYADMTEEEQTLVVDGLNTALRSPSNA